MELLAKLEEEEGGQDLAREQLRGVILVLLMHLSMLGWSVGGIENVANLLPECTEIFQELKHAKVLSGFDTCI